MCQRVYFIKALELKWATFFSWCKKNGWAMKTGLWMHWLSIPNMKMCGETGYFWDEEKQKNLWKYCFICVLIVLAIFCCVFENKGSFCFSGSAHKLNWIFLLQFLKFGFISCFCFCSLFFFLSLVCMNVRASGCLLVEGWDVNAHLCGNRLLLP